MNLFEEEMSYSLIFLLFRCKDQKWLIHQKKGIGNVVPNNEVLSFLVRIIGAYIFMTFAEGRFLIIVVNYELFFF